MVLNAAAQSLTNKIILDNSNQIDADVIETTGAGVSTTFALSPVVGTVFTAGTSTVGQWLPETVSANWVPVYSNIVGMTGTPNTTYASYQAVGLYVSCVIEYEGMTRAGGVVEFDINLPIPRSGGNFPASPLGGVGVGSVVRVGTSSAPFSVLPVAGTQRMRAEPTVVNGVFAMGFNLEFVYKLT